MPRARKPAPPIHTFRVKLLGGPADIRDDIWRDIEIAANQTLGDLGHLLPYAFDFDEDHMWSFFLSGRPWDSATEYAWHGPLDNEGGRDPDRLHIRDAPLRGKRGGKGWLFIFDYGDEWHFDVAFQGASDDVDLKADYPRVVGSHGDAPPQYPRWDDEEGDEDDEDDEELSEEDEAAIAELGELIQQNPALVEAAATKLERILKDKQFESPEELAAYIDSGEWVEETGEPDTPLGRAQELVYEAWVAPTKRERVRLAKQAIKISPDCADAYSLLASETASTSEEEIALLQQAVAAGERALGLQGLEEYRGDFWGVLETRPYMRARADLADALWEAGRQEEAISHWEDLLRLNPDDNQGIRYLLLTTWLTLGDHERVKGLLKQYPDDGAATWLYGQALNAFAQEGDTKKSRRLRAEAIAANSFVPAYLTGKKRLPKALPELMGIGDMAEAQWCAAEQMAAWQQTPGALEWLAGVM